jgi:polysaccharide export outer membrane protein
MSTKTIFIYKLAAFLLSVMFISSCKNQAIMFQTKRNYTFDDASKIPDIREYKIAVNDELNISISPNKGANVFENTDVNVNRGVGTTVDYEGSIKLPIVGRIKISNLTVREAELLMEDLLKTYYVDPYVTIKVLSKRVVLFGGGAGAARVIPLPYQNMNLLEVLAISGGIPPSGKAHRIKIIRGDLKDPQIYLIDLSKIENLKKSDLIVQGDDIIYVDFRNDYAQNLLNRLAPTIGLINLGLTTYFFLNLVK